MANNLENTGVDGATGWRIARWSLIAGLIALPWFAMQVSQEWQWTLFDFVFIGVLLIGAGLLFELAVWRLRRPAYRIVAAAGILAVVLMVWVEGAVGIFR